MGAQAVTGAVRTVALPVAEEEACLTPVDLRLRAKVSKHLVRLHTLPSVNQAIDFFSYEKRNQEDASVDKE